MLIPCRGALSLDAVAEKISPVLRNPIFLRLRYQVINIYVLFSLRNMCVYVCMKCVVERKNLLNSSRCKILETKEDNLDGLAFAIYHLESRFRVDDQTSFSLIESFRNTVILHITTLMAHVWHKSVYDLYSLAHATSTLAISKTFYCKNFVMHSVLFNRRVGRVFLLGIHFEGSTYLRKYINTYARVSGGY